MVHADALLNKLYYSKPSLMNLTPNIQHYGHFTLPQNLFSYKKKILI